MSNTRDDTPAPPPRKIRYLSGPCTMCGRMVAYATVTSPHPEAPEMFSAAQGCWLGFARDEDADTFELVLACSEHCVQSLLKEGPPS